MTYTAVMRESGPDILAISVGNTNTQFARFQESEQPGERTVVPNSERADLIESLVCAAEPLRDVARGAIVLASVNDPVAEVIETTLKNRLGVDVYRLGRDLDIAIEQATSAATRTGQDRLLNALAAFNLFKQACTVVDAGTAVTVDFVDGVGVFQGGAIAPGAHLALSAMRGATAALPAVALRRPEPGVFGKDTEQAMLNGVCFGIQGMVRMLVERYAESYEAYPLVVTTGGDAELLFGEDPIVEKIVPDLTLRGIALACRRALIEDESE